MGNYHWYLKQNLCFTEVSAVSWDVEHAYKMHIACKDGQYVQYTWAWTTDHSFGLTKDDLSTVAVIDGGKISNFVITFEVSKIAGTATLLIGNCSNKTMVP